MAPPRWASISSPGSVAGSNSAFRPAAVTAGTRPALTGTVPGVAARAAGSTRAGSRTSRRRRRIARTSPYEALLLLLGLLSRLLLAALRGGRLPDGRAASQRLALLLGELR